MNEVFADAAFYVALLNPSDQYHRQAVQLAGELSHSLVVTEFVLIEVASAMRLARNRHLFVEMLRQLRADPLILIVPATADLFQAGVELFARRLDKDWSLVDCISFVVMEDRGLTEALTTDHHFAQAGFTVLIKDATE